MTLRYHDGAGGAFDPDDHGRVVRVGDPDDDYDDDDLLDDDWYASDEPEQLSRTRADLEESAKDVRERIEDRRRHGANDQSLAADLRLLEALGDQLREAQDEQAHAEAAERQRKAERAEGQLPGPRVRDPWREALAAELSAEDLALYDARRGGVGQARIARDLGISQSAVSKREARIVAAAQSLHERLNGRPLLSLEKRRPGVRGKARNIPPSL